MNNGKLLIAMLIGASASAFIIGFLLMALEHYMAGGILVGTSVFALVTYYAWMLL